MPPQLFSVPKEGSEAYSYKPNKDHLIGKGGFAHIFRATRKHDQKVFAIKRSMTPVELLDEKEHQAVFEEIRLMKENPHPFIVKVIDDFLDDSGHLCMV
jgi:serine/threonine protein kinase